MTNSMIEVAHEDTQDDDSQNAQKFGAFHLRIVITAGMGFFADAYDLFIIGIVTAIIAPIWHLTIYHLALLNAAALASAAVGALFFGNLSDRFGRKKMYGLEVFILFVGALLSAFSVNFTMLLISRIIVGLGIGGDYPTSAVVASEFSGRKQRGYLVLLVFAMQAVGLIVGPFVASIFLALHINPDITWRILLGLGAVPAASVFYLRRKISETPHFLKVKNAPLEVSHAVTELTTSYTEPRPKLQSLFVKKWIKYLLGTAGAWFLLDVAFYGNGISSVLIMKSIDPHASLLSHTIISAGIFICFAVPGYFLAAKYVDKIGRKLLQIIGFAVIALCYFALSLFSAHQITDFLPLFIAIFGLSFFFVNFGPNTTTFLIPSEIYPTSIRARAHGFSAAVGKMGAFVGAFALPHILTDYGMSVSMQLMTLVCVLGIFVTFLVPEMKNKELS